MSQDFRIGDRIEDFEGDMATVRDIQPDGRLVIEWDCNPGHQVMPHPSYPTDFINHSAQDRDA